MPGLEEIEPIELSSDRSTARTEDEEPITLVDLPYPLPRVMPSWELPMGRSSPIPPPSVRPSTGGVICAISALLFFVNLALLLSFAIVEPLYNTCEC